MIRIRNHQRKIKVSLPKIKRTIRRILKILDFPYDPELSILLVNDRRIKDLNFQYRGCNEATDVLSFPAEPYPPLIPPLQRGGRGRVVVLGDIIISMPAVIRQAKEGGIDMYDEINNLLIHSILHLLGYTHESNFDARKMKRKEREIALSLRSSLSLRGEAEAISFCSG